jgi:hypothetical protein
MRSPQMRQRRRREPKPMLRERDFRKWHQTDMTAASSHVRFQGQTGKYLLAVSISPFDLGCVKTRASRECAELFSPFSSFDGYSQRCSFPNQPNRDKISTRKFDVGVFTQPGPTTDIGQRLMLQQRSRFQPLSKCSFDRLRCSVLGPLGWAINRRREFITLVGGASAGLVSTQPLMQC